MKSPEVEICLTFGSLQRSVSLSDLSLHLGLSALALRQALTSLLAIPFHSAGNALRVPKNDPVPTIPSEGETTEGEERFDSLKTELIPKRFGRSGGGAGEPRRETSVDISAHTCAHLLGDLENLGAYESLFKTFPPDLLETALARTLRVPSSRLTRSRGAYFTALLRILARARSSASHSPQPSSYARTPPAPP